MDLIQATLFDYQALDAETRIVVQQRTSEIKALMKRAAQDILDIGQKLIEVKARIGHGHFGAWLAAEFDWSQDTANNFIRVAQRFSDIPKISEFAPSALYLLAAPSTPEPARLEALERAEAGEAISYSTAREIVAEHRQVAPPAATDTVLVPDPPDPVVVTTTETTPRAYSMMPVMSSSASPEWYTPKHILEAVQAVLGVIELDPCSNPPPYSVPALRHYTQADDGLAQSWEAATVFMNPPYGDVIGLWIDRLVTAYETGELEAAVALVPGRIDTQWFQALYAYPLCCVRGRLRFSEGDSAPFPSVLAYLGPDPDRFITVFRALGPIVQRIDEGE